MTGRVGVAFQHAGGFNLGKETESLHGVPLLVQVLESASSASMEGSMVGYVRSCKMSVDVILKGSHT
jgi:hypothetical protein